MIEIISFRKRYDENRMGRMKYGRYEKGQKEKCLKQNGQNKLG